MMTVRFPSGVAVTYNNANFLSYKTSAWELHTGNPDKGGSWVCSIPLSTGCIVEVVQPCVVENATLTLKKALAHLANPVESLRGCDNYSLARLKRKLTCFNARTRCWRAAS